MHSGVASPKLELRRMVRSTVLAVVGFTKKVVDTAAGVLHCVTVGAASFVGCADRNEVSVYYYYYTGRRFPT